MAGDPPPPQPVILLSDKLMTITNLTNLIPVKLDVEDMNYTSWVYFFYNLILFWTTSRQGYG